MNEDDRAYREADETYRRVLEAYGEALRARDRHSAELFAQATAAWERLRSFERRLEAELDSDMHLIHAFSYAQVAGDVLEAKRLYDAMGDEDREAVDTAESMSPGSVKIWL